MDTPFDVPKTRLDGLRRIFDARLVRPHASSFTEYSAMDEDARETFDEARLFWLRNGLRINTLAQRRADRDLTRIMRSNRLAYSGRAGLILNGPPVHGKSEIALTLARRVEAQRAKAQPRYRELGEAPVVWTHPPSNASGKAFMSAICNFFTPDLPLPTRWTTPRIFDEAIERMRNAKTGLLIIDEAHRLASHQRGDHGDPTDMIKEIQNQSPATVVLAGVDLMHADVFGTARGKQVLRRCDRIEIEPSTNSTETAANEWNDIVSAFDAALPLCDHVPGLLTANSANLLTATDGCLGDLAGVMQRLVEDIVGQSDRVDEDVTPERLTDALMAFAMAQGNDKTHVPSVSTIRRAKRSAA